MSILFEFEDADVGEMEAPVYEFVRRVFHSAVPSSTSTTIRKDNNTPRTFGLPWSIQIWTSNFQ